ncbi:hypothetical protein ACHMW7_09225 [Aminobacter sp. UC22_36]|uniref:hypothetical protein n=1 Tax=Aminobacter sp. UC22_36 TaxID=3374549 RepID=UPI0037565494
MPRNGLGVMSWPPNTNGVPNTTVSSIRYNAFLADLLADLNAVRPINAGGTGGTSAVSGNDGLNTSGADMASAATLNLANATGVVITVTGTTGITALGTVSSGAMRTLIFAGALTLTHNATSLILPGAANITTAAGDVAEFRSKGAGNWVCVGYQRANGAPVVNPDASATAKGIVELATNAEAIAKADAVRVLVPANLAALGSSDTLAGLVEIADQTEMEAGSSTMLAVSPGRQHFHPSAAKCWGYATVSGGVPTLQASYNISGIVDNGTADISFTVGTDFSSANWACIPGCSNSLRPPTSSR